jgi:alkylation response protein AidB-like acyl-CoA dehydrogenase
MSPVILLKPHQAAEAVADRLATRLAATAAERDRAGGHAATERQWIGDSGLLTLTIPTVHGGQGSDWPTFYRVLRRLAEADSALAHVFGFHHLQLASVALYGNPAQHASYLRGTVELGWFWGNALNPLDKRLVATEVGGGFRLDGVKGFASGSVGSDQLVVSAWLPAAQGLVVGVVPTRRDGVAVQADWWDAFGQRQTDSGTVTFDAVTLSHAEVLQAAGTVPTPRPRCAPSWPN